MFSSELVRDGGAFGARPILIADSPGGGSYQPVLTITEETTGTPEAPTQPAIDVEQAIQLGQEIQDQEETSGGGLLTEDQKTAIKNAFPYIAAAAGLLLLINAK